MPTFDLPFEITRSDEFSHIFDGFGSIQTLRCADGKVRKEQQVNHQLDSLNKREVIIYIYENSDLLDWSKEVSVRHFDSDVEVLEIHWSNRSIEFALNHHTQLNVRNGANVQYGQVFVGDAKMSIEAHVDIQVFENSKLDFFNLSLACPEAKHFVSAELCGDAAEFGLYTLSRVLPGHQVENKSHIIHKLGNTKSTQIVNNILFENSKSLFEGRLQIDEQAQKSDAKQKNHNLLLSESCEAIARPQLEVAADDVKAAHGATVGQIQDEELFYLMSRGIPRSSAMRMLSRGFERAVFSEVKSSQMRRGFDGLLSLSDGEKIYG